MKERLKEARLSSGYKNRKDLADALGISVRTYEKYEYGTKPSKAFIQLFCSKLNVNETWLRTGEGEMHAPVSSASRRGTIYGIAINKGNKYMDSFVAALEKLSDEDLEKVYNLAKNWVNENEKETEY